MKERGFSKRRRERGEGEMEGEGGRKGERIAPRKSAE